MNCGTSTSALIDKLKVLFSKFGIVHTLVSDNDTKICSSEFNSFCTANGIKYLTSPIYHPASNGQAENSVKTCKKMLKCITMDRNVSHKQIEEKLLGFLFDYRNTVHCSTGKSPAELMFGRKLRTRLDLILPSKHDNVLNRDLNETHLKPSRVFKIGDIVWAKWFVAKKAVWAQAKICKIIGSRMFEVMFTDLKVMRKRHLNQIFKYTGPIPPSQSCDNNVESGMGPSVDAIPHSPPTPPPSSTGTPPLPTPAPSSPPPPSSTSAPPCDNHQQPPIITTDGGDSVVREDGGDEQEVWVEATDTAGGDNVVSEPAPVCNLERPTNDPNPEPAVGTNEAVGSIGGPVKRSHRTRDRVDYKKYF